MAEDKATLEVVIRLRDEMTRRLDAVEQAVNKTGKTVVNTSKDMDTGWKQAERSLLNVRSILGHISAAYLLMKGIQTFKQMAMEAEDVRASVERMQTTFHDVFAPIAQESARFWTPVLEKAFLAMDMMFVSFRLIILKGWKFLMTTLTTGISELEWAAQKLPDALVPDGLVSAIDGVGAATMKQAVDAENAIGAETSAMEDLIKQWKDLGEATGTAKIGKAKGPGKKDSAFDVKGYISSLDEVKGGYVEIMAEYSKTVKATSELGPMASHGIEMATGKLEDMDEIQKQVTENAEIMDSVYKQAADMDIAAMNKKLEATRALMAELRDTLGAIGDSIINTFGQAFDDFADGHLKPTVEYVKSALRDIASMLLRMAMQKALSAALDAISNAATSGASGAVSSAPMLVAARGGVFNSFSDRYPLRKYGGGGITNGPEIAIIGEGRKREAVVPLDNGDKVPVELKGGGERPIVVNINGAIDGDSVARLMTSRRGQAALRAGMNRVVQENANLAGAPA